MRNEEGVCGTVEGFVAFDGGLEEWGYGYSVNLTRRINELDMDCCV